jgi:RNA polymerase sigma-70 factor (ECF subfamily)
MCNDRTEDERARRFRDIALPYLDDVYRLAYFLMRSRADADDAVQECYLRAWRHFESWRGADIKPWLHAIVRNVCFVALSRRDRRETPTDLTEHERATDQILWQEPPESAEAGMLDREQSESVRKIVFSLPAELREIIVLREYDDLSYREIATIAGVPIGTVMSRLARARALFAREWNKASENANASASAAPLSYPRITA